MPRGSRIFLSFKKFYKLSSTNPQHPRIRRHVISLIIITEYRRSNPVAVIEESKSRNKVPYSFRGILNLFVSRFLNRPTDLSITPIALWWIHQSKYLPPVSDPNHHAIYFKHRHLSPKELSTYSIRRLDLLAHQIQSVTTIFQDRQTILYSAPNLHSTPHGSMNVNVIPHYDSVLRSLKIDHSIIRLEDTDNSGSMTRNGISVAFLHHNQLDLLKNSILGGLDNFHRELALHLLQTSSKKDINREDGKIYPNKFSFITSCKWGFGRVQHDNHHGTWSFRGVKMPTLDTQPFLDMSETLQANIFCVLEHGTSYSIQTNQDAFCDPTRSSLFATTINASMGRIQSTSKFEYVHIVLSHNVQLKEHIDWKNDHRHGYNLCIVYSTLIEIENLPFRLSIIMTTRTTVGAALELAYSM